MNVKLKRKLAFALLLGVVTTGIISFVLIALNVGFSETFAYYGCGPGVSHTWSWFPRSC